MSPRNDDNYLPALRFHWLTPFYDVVIKSAAERRFKQALIDQARIEAGHRVLDLGCGTGTLALWIRQQQSQAEVTGVDCDPAILAMAKRKAQSEGVAVSFDLASAVSLPYPDGSFDRVLSSLVFHHLPWEQKQQAASEIFRVLRPGGELHVADWGRPANRLMRIMILLEQLYDGFANTRDNVAGRLGTLFEQAGFEAVAEPQRLNTFFGTLAFYRATRPV